MIHNRFISCLLPFCLKLLLSCFIIFQLGFAKEHPTNKDKSHTFKAEENSNTNNPNEVESLVPSCTPPSSLSASTVSCESAQITWVEGEEAVSYDLRFRLANTDTWTNINNLSNSSFLLEGLQELNTYEWQMRASCPDSLSNWINGEDFDTFNGVEIASFDATQDTYVDSDNGDQNFNQQNSLRIFQSGQTSQELISYISFDVSGVDFTGVEAVKLRVLGLLGNSPVQVNMGVFISSPFDETQITANSAPAFSEDPLGSFVGTLSASGIIEIEMSVDSFLFDGIYSLALAPLGEMSELILFTSDSPDGPELIYESPFSCEPCVVPANLATANVSPTSVDISWGEVEPARSYDVRFKPDVNNEWSAPINVDNTSTSLTGLVSNTTYNWQVRSICQDDTTEYTDGTDFTTLALCEAPDGLGFDSVTTESAFLTWNPVDVAINYDLQFKAQGQNSFTTVNDLSGTSFMLSGIEAGVEYEWQVRSSCPGEDTEYSVGPNFTTLPDSSCNSPTPLPVDVVSPDSVRLQWEAELSALSYALRYRPEGDTIWINVFDIPTTLFILQGLIPLTTYEWQLASICDGDTSEYASGANFASSTDQACDAPSNLQSSTGDETVSLSWDPSLTADRYDLRFKLADASVFSFVDSITTNSFDLTGLVSDSQYNWGVRSACGNSTSVWIDGTDFTTDITTSLADFKELKISVYPNPSNKFFTIEVLNSTQAFVTFSVVNAFGQIVLHKDKQSTNLPISIGSDWAAGVYFIRLFDGEAVGDWKIIKSE